MESRIDLVWWYAKTRYLRRFFTKGINMVDLPDETARLLEDNFLLEDLAFLLEQLNTQIKEVEKEAHELGCEPHEMRTAANDWPLRSVIVAKAHCLSAIALMKSVDGMASSMMAEQVYKSQ